MAGGAGREGPARITRLSTATLLALVERDAQYTWHAASAYSIAGLREEAMGTLELAVLMPSYPGESRNDADA